MRILIAIGLMSGICVSLVPFAPAADVPAAKAEKAEITVGGQVKRPGAIAFTEGMTLHSAIEAAGGGTEFASLKRVSLARGGDIKMYDMRNEAFRKIPLSPGDVITVPQKMLCGEEAPAEAVYQDCR